MAASGYTPILLYASGTASNVPLAANLTSTPTGAELAVNYADGKLYYKNSAGVVTLLAPTLAGVGATGTWPISISGSAASTSSASAISNAGGWSVTPTGTKLYFNYNGTNVASLDSSGNLIALANVVAYGTP